MQETRLATLTILRATATTFTPSGASIKEAVFINPKIQKVINEITKTKDKLHEAQERLKELERQRIELENTEIVALFRSVDVAPENLADFITAYKAQGSARPATAPATTIMQEDSDEE